MSSQSFRSSDWIIVSTLCGGSVLLYILSSLAQSFLAPPPGEDAYWLVSLGLNLLGYATVRPAVNQVEIHPYNQRVGLEQLVRSEGIRFEAYSPLGKGRIGLFEDPVLVSIAKAKNKSVAAVILRWLLQRGITPIPLSRNERRIRDNLNVFDFALSTVNHSVTPHTNQPEELPTIQGQVLILVHPGK